MKLSLQYAHYHTSTFYPRGCTTRKFSLAAFKKEACIAHLLGRASCAQRIIDAHKKDPYKTIDELIGDLQIEVVNTMNDFKKISGSTIPTLTIENAYLKKGETNVTSD